MLKADLMMNKKQSYGFSLVELLVAMVVGLIIVSGAFSLHSTTRKTQAVNEMQMDMVADARFAIEMIAYDLRHAGMWGGTNKGSLIDCRARDAACAASSAGETIPSDAATGNDCAAAGAPAWYYDLSRPVFATNNSNPHSGTCIPGSEGYVAGTDVLEVRYADSNLTGALVPSQAYVRSNFIDGRLFIGTTQPVLDSYDAVTFTQNYELRAYAYYVSNFTDAAADGIPSLRRVALVNAPRLDNQVLISGVVNLQVQFGEDIDDVKDSDGNVTIDRYVNPGSVTDWSKVYAAKIWVVMRSDNTQVGVDTSKTFPIAGANVNYGGVNGFRHFMTTSVVNLRNLKQI